MQSLFKFSQILSKLQFLHLLCQSFQLQPNVRIRIFVLHPPGSKSPPQSANLLGPGETLCVTLIKTLLECFLFSSAPPLPVSKSNINPVSSRTLFIVLEMNNYCSTTVGLEHCIRPEAFLQRPFFHPLPFSTSNL